MWFKFYTESKVKKVIYNNKILKIKIKILWLSKWVENKNKIKIKRCRAYVYIYWFLVYFSMVSSRSLFLFVLDSSSCLIISISSWSSSLALASIWASLCNATIFIDVFGLLFIGSVRILWTPGLLFSLYTCTMWPVIILSGNSAIKFHFLLSICVSRLSSSSAARSLLRL